MRQHKPPHVGQFIKEVYLEPFEGKISRSEIARHLDVSRSTFNRLVKGESSLTASMALRLSKVLGGTPESWLNIQLTYDLWKTRKSVNLSKTIRFNISEYY